MSHTTSSDGWTKLAISVLLLGVLAIPSTAEDQHFFSFFASRRLYFYYGRTPGCFFSVFEIYSSLSIAASSILEQTSRRS